MATTTRRPDNSEECTSLGHPTGEAALEGARFTMLDAAMLGSLALSVGCNIVSALLAVGWVTAALTDVLLAAYFALVALDPQWRPVLARLALFGLVAGICELFTDAAGAYVAHSLIYPAGAPMLVASPFYMPLSWALVLMQLGYLAWRLAGLSGRLPLWGACAILFAWGAINIPFYEEMAFHAGWWRYVQVRAVGHTPLYVLLFEGLVAASLPLLLRDLPRLTPRALAVRGMLLGIWFPWAALFAWLALGR